MTVDVCTPTAASNAARNSNYPGLSNFTAKIAEHAEENIHRLLCDLGVLSG
jgi:hypothetical protein